jgi:hypothetical protein
MYHFTIKSNRECHFLTSSKYKTAMASLQPSPHVNCSAQSIPYPDLPGAQIRSLEAFPVHKGWKYIPKGFYSNNGAVGAASLHYCNVTITYTPLNSTNQTEVQIWLPETWNGRMQGVGGGGWSAGLYTNGYPSMTAAVAQGFAVTSTNGGYRTGDARDWALLAPGKVDYKSFEHYATTSLNDLAVIGKKLLRDTAEILVLERLLARRTPGLHARTALSQRFRRNCRKLSRD